jgi:hypothetical protein
MAAEESILDNEAEAPVGHVAAACFWRNTSDVLHMEQHLRRVVSF